MDLCDDIYVELSHYVPIKSLFIMSLCNKKMNNLCVKSEKIKKLKLICDKKPLKNKSTEEEKNKLSYYSQLYNKFIQKFRESWVEKKFNFVIKDTKKNPFKITIDNGTRYISSRIHHKFIFVGLCNDKIIWKKEVYIMNVYTFVEEIFFSILPSINGCGHFEYFNTSEYEKEYVYRKNKIMYDDKYGNKFIPRWSGKQLT